MMYREFKVSIAVFAVIVAALAVNATHAFAQSDASAWAESVDPNSLAAADVAQDPADAKKEIRELSRRLQSLKSDVLELNHDLRQMEEQLLFPSSTKYAIFVSLSSGQFFDLESVKLKLNGRLVATHVYSGKHREALLRGGVHRLYVTNLAEGEHDATAFFTGIGPGGRAYKRATSVQFKKGANSGYLEIAVGDDPVKQEPVFAIKQW